MAGMLFAAEELLKLCKRMRQLDVRKLFHKHTIAVYLGIDELYTNSHER